MNSPNFITPSFIRSNLPLIGSGMIYDNKGERHEGLEIYSGEYGFTCIKSYIGLIGKANREEIVIFPKSSVNRIVMPPANEGSESA